MSNRDETAAAPFNDFAALIIGATRDNINAKQLLTGDLYYYGDPNLTAAPSNLVNDIIMSNNHFAALENLNYDLSKVLVKMKTPVTPLGGQVLYDGKGTIVPAKTFDAAGLLTTRAFMAAHAIAGTNRRLIEYSFREFLCQPMNKWSDNTAPDDRVGMDVDRFPTNDHAKYQVSCRACHGQMDALRPAFARFTFETNYVKHAWLITRDAITDPNEANNNENIDTMVQSPIGIAGKYNKNSDVFSKGYPVADTEWLNYITRGQNVAYFGWNKNYMQGRGVASYGQMISESRAYPECLAKRAFRAVCNRDVESFDMDAINRVIAPFTDANVDNFNLRLLFERVAIQPECLGQ